MLKQKSKLLPAVLLGGFLTIIAFTSCNDSEKTKTTETITEPAKMDSMNTMMDSSNMPKMDTATTRPIKPGN
ncbi:MAG: hypothetical protein ABJA37_13080 [Ferruginibacter sp.]